MPVSTSSRFARAAVGAVLAICAAYFYVWIARADASPFGWTYDLGGYYNFLGRAFAAGRLDLPIDPKPELLALPNPWDPKVDDALKMHDMALYGGRYYLYHGAGPALLLFAPWRLLTGHDLPEDAAVVIFCVAGFLLGWGALTTAWRLAAVTPDWPIYLASLLALAFCNSVPYLLNRVLVYEVAIAGGYFCVFAGLFFLARHLLVGCPFYLAAAGLFCGVAVACRPHLGLLGAFILAALTVRGLRDPVVGGIRRVVPFALPFAVCLLAIAWYNYARFGNPAEFGIRYLLSGENQQRIATSAAYVLPGLYYFLACRPEMSAVFPWFGPALRAPLGASDNRLPEGYFLEAIAGALFLAPFLLLTPLAAARAEKSLATLKWLILPAALAAVGILLFLTTTGFVTQRYEVDFLPLAVWAAMTVLSVRLLQAQRRTSRVLSVLVLLLALAGTAVNAAVGVLGPYADFLRNRPEAYISLARRLTPSSRWQPLLNPRIDVEMTATLSPATEGYREPLLTIGSRAHFHLLYAEHGPGIVRLVSQSEMSTKSYDMPLTGPLPLRLYMAYLPETGETTLELDGREVVRHAIKTWMTAPGQVTPGENHADPWRTAPRFSGALHFHSIQINMR